MIASYPSNHLGHDAHNYWKTSFRKFKITSQALIRNVGD